MQGHNAQINEIAPAPASIGSDIPLAYFGPAPSSVNPLLVGPLTLLKTAKIDFEKGTATIPLYRGDLVSSSYSSSRNNKYKRGANDKYIWYVVTDSDDSENAAALGLNFSPKLRYTNVEGAVRRAKMTGAGTLTFYSGTVDFTPKRSVVPGTSSPFPPKSATPGSRGDSEYSPLVFVENLQSVYNAPIIAGYTSASNIDYCSGIPENEKETAYRYLHDKVVSLCPPKDDSSVGSVTLRLTQGFSFGKPVFYLSFDASDSVTATLEEVTFAPNLGLIGVGRDDSLFSGVERIFVTANGYTNKNINTARRTDGPRETAHPLRQGLNSAISDGKSPLNILGGIPTVATDYSPMWDVNLGVWTRYAIENHYRTRIIDEFTYLGMVERGFITGPDGAEFGSTGIVVNCPIVHRFL